MLSPAQTEQNGCGIAKPVAGPFPETRPLAKSAKKKMVALPSYPFQRVFPMLSYVLGHSHLDGTVVRALFLPCLHRL